MSKFYTANAELAELLTNELGFTFHDREDEKVKYFTEHTTGKQVKLDFEKSLVYLLSPYGVTEDSSSSFTDTQIKKFLSK